MTGIPSSSPDTEQRKSSLKKVEAELDEAEEIVSPRPSSVLTSRSRPLFSLPPYVPPDIQPPTDLSDGDRASLHATQYPDAVPDEVDEQ